MTCLNPTLQAQQAEQANKPEDCELGQQGESEILTRRMQFRMKKHKKEQRQKKKEEKALQKVEKEKVKAEKQKAREQKKQEKAMKDSQKKKRVAKKGHDEQDSKKVKKSRAKKRPFEEDVVENAQDESAKSKPEEQGQEPVVKEKENVVQHGDSGPDVGHSEGKAKDETQHASPTRKHVKNAKLVKLRRMMSKNKMMSSPANCATNGSRKRKTNTKHAISQKSGASGASSVAPKSTKKGKSRKVKSPVKGQPAKKSKPSKSKPSKPDPCPKIVALVQGILSQCQDSECTHPTWSAPKFDMKKFSVSVYWNRHAVGVKVAKAFLQGKKCKGSGKFSQVAYFGSPTPCIYSNLAVAHEFATCMHICARFFWGDCICVNRCLLCQSCAHINI